ncbi:hypothetical protein ERJ75_000352700 [Trypanosoma vivax]|uniref:Kinetoplastid kinetochore protein 8 n=1 Tax=Trypanosoma vivax (strain Y486) TaxID=1055687 RepID=G0TZP4_TRYVY|nr:hypothetical protein TRVL_07215 [Trypanosoma vivax]KAH8617714.1 hypothetical protein ERJ75_000352700 [Trypanosoma vivax]CCC50072.1 conserved hypothetical protein [Trypanosoma vivax Y486]
MRSTTPPLYYRRPEGIPAAYHVAGAVTTPPPLRVHTHPSIPGQQSATTVRTTQNEAGVPAAATYPTVTGRHTGGPHGTTPNQYFQVPRVSNPFGYLYPSIRTSAATEEQVTASVSAELLAHGSVRTSNINFGTDPLSALEMEEASLVAEERTVRAKLAELQRTREQQNEDHQSLCRGWAALLDREERYFTEPVVDFAEELMARERRCALLQERLKQVEALLEDARLENQQHDSAVKEGEVFEKEVSRVRDGFIAVERRRKLCKIQAEHMFDVESRRAIESARHAGELEDVLQGMVRSGPLSQTQTHLYSRDASIAQKSIVLDLEARDESVGDIHKSEASEDGNEETQGLSQRAVDSPRGLNEDEDGPCSISGRSASYSLNHIKRARFEVSAV